MSEALKQPISLHLVELRRRMLIATGTYVLAVILCYTYAAEIYGFLVLPLANIYKAMGAERKLIFTSLTEAFFTHIKIAFFAAFILAFPVISWQIYFFIAPGLFKHEKKLVIPYMLAAPVLFCLGAALVYYYIMPLAWQFFLSFETSSAGIPIVLEARVSEYLALATSLIIAFGVAFQLPLILVLLTHIGIVKADFFFAVLLVTFLAIERFSIRFKTPL